MEELLEEGESLSFGGGSPGMPPTAPVRDGNSNKTQGAERNKFLRRERSTFAATVP